MARASSREANVYCALDNSLAKSRRHRRILVLRFFADLSERQIAEALGIAPGTVKSRLARALDQLSKDEQLMSGVRDVD